MSNKLDMTRLEGLAEVINQHTGVTGAQLEGFTFYLAAAFADAHGRNDIGDYFAKQCNDARDRSKDKAA